MEQSVLRRDNTSKGESFDQVVILQKLYILTEIGLGELDLEFDSMNFVRQMDFENDRAPESVIFTFSKRKN